MWMMSVLHLYMLIKSQNDDDAEDADDDDDWQKKMGFCILVMINSNIPYERRDV